MNGINLFRAECGALNTPFPDLILIEENDQPVLTGQILLKEDDLLIDTYQVRILPTPNYPQRFPLVFETGGRLPRNIDWHVFSDGHCCIKSFPEEIYICRQGISLEGFISGQVIPYFFNQKYRELNGFFLNERKHGDAGNLQFFQDLFKTNDLKIIAIGLLKLWKKEIPNRVCECFCGSGKKYRSCHKQALQQLQIYSKNDLEICLSILNKFLPLKSILV